MRQGHRLDLIVGHIDRRHLQFMLEVLQLGAHLHAQLRVEVGQRLVHQEDARRPDDGAGERYPLALAAG